MFCLRDRTHYAFRLCVHCSCTMCHYIYYEFGQGWCTEACNQEGLILVYPSTCDVLFLITRRHSTPQKLLRKCQRNVTKSDPWMPPGSAVAMRGFRTLSNQQCRSGLLFFFPEQNGRIFSSPCVVDTFLREIISITLHAAATFVSRSHHALLFSSLSDMLKLLTSNGNYCTI